MADEMDGLEKHYSELVSQISLEVAVVKQQKPAPEGPTVSLRALVEASELNFVLEDDLC